MPQLEIKNTQDGQTSTISIESEDFIIGRIDSCDLTLADKAISRRHAQLSYEDGDYFLSDLRSGNGTKLKGKRVRPLEKHLVQNGDIIEIEHFRLRFIGEATPGEQKFGEDTDTDILEIKLIKKMMQALDEGEEASLEVLSGSAAGLKFSLKEGQESFNMGRSEEADFCIPDNVLSRLHAKLERKWGGVVLTDLDSKNGCFINNENIKEKLLRDGDRILLGTVRLLYRDPKEVKAHIAHQELSRKKKEAALQEAEALARKQLEEEKKQAEEAARKQAEAEAEAQALEESLEKEKADQEESAQATTTTEQIKENTRNAQLNSPSEISPPLEKEKLSKAEKIMIALSILVGLGAVGALLALFL